jgi:hypothetical protein
MEQGTLNLLQVQGARVKIHVLEVGCKCVINLLDWGFCED